MRSHLEMLPGVALCIALALCGDWLAVRFGLPLPGAVLGLLAYLGWLVMGRGIGWSRSGAALMLRWIGAMIVPALIGLQAQAGVLSGQLLPLLALLVISTLVTAAVTAGLYRLAGGRR